LATLRSTPIAKMVTSAPGRRKLLLGYFNEGVASWLSSVDRVHDPREGATDKTPSVSSEDDDCNLAGGQVLLINQIFVGRQQDIEFGFLGCTQQFPVQEHTPSLLTCRFDSMAVEGIPNANRRPLVKRDKHQLAGAGTSSRLLKNRPARLFSFHCSSFRDVE
jgi:hypothetical protein